MAKTAESNINIMVDVKTEDVINEVRKRECLWNPKAAGYKYGRKRAWQQVCESIIPDYKTRSYLEKRQIEKAIQVRWRSARITYFKCKRRQLEQTCTYKYVYYDSLKFLDDDSIAEASDDGSDGEEKEQITSSIMETHLQRDDQSFFNSLAPLLNELDSYKKIVFRSRILELAAEVGDLRSNAK